MNMEHDAHEVMIGSSSRMQWTISANHLGVWQNGSTCLRWVCQVVMHALLCMSWNMKNDILNIYFFSFDCIFLTLVITRYKLLVTLIRSEVAIFFSCISLKMQCICSYLFKHVLKYISSITKSMRRICSDPVLPIIAGKMVFCLFLQPFSKINITAIHCSICTNLMLQCSCIWPDKCV